jgi:SAM-dependent methyltransferase
MEIKTCNYCGSTDQDRLFVIPDLLLNRHDYKATFVKCKSCGLVFQNPQPSIEDLIGSYPQKYHTYVKSIKKNSKLILERLVHNFGKWIRNRQVFKYKNKGRLLDIGCGNGNFLAGLKSYSGWELFGIEPNQNTITLDQELLSLNIKNSTLEEAGFQSNFFDVITLWDVFEHLRDPSSSLHEIHRILKPNGILIMRIPNGNSWEAKIFNSYWAGLDPPRHLYVFTPKLIKLILHKNNFKVLDLNTLWGGFSTFLLSLQFLQTSRSTNKFLILWLLIMLNRPFARVVFSPVFRILGLGLRGSEITVTATISE